MRAFKCAKQCQSLNFDSSVYKYTTVCFLMIFKFNPVFRIESCVAGRYRNARITATEAARAYAELVQRNWAESGCTADLTILYIGTLHNPLTNLRQPNPFVVRLFS